MVGLAGIEPRPQDYQGVTKSRVVSIHPTCPDFAVMAIVRFVIEMRRDSTTRWNSIVGIKVGICVSRSRRLCGPIWVLLDSFSYHDHATPWPSRKVRVALLMAEL
jgi:hypothetical protein